jgi:hypothetical protein
MAAAAAAAGKIRACCNHKKQGIDKNNPSISSLKFI